MAEMTAALCAVHFGARHEEAAVDGRVDGALDRRPEARPSGAALEFRVGREQRRATGGAFERAGSLFAVEPARTGALGAVLAEHVKLIARQRALPIVIGLLHSG